MWNRNNEISEFMRQSRKDVGLTQAQFANIAGVGLRFIRDLEQGKPNLTTGKVNQVLEFFGKELSIKDKVYEDDDEC